MVARLRERVAVRTGGGEVRACRPVQRSAEVQRRVEFRDEFEELSPRAEVYGQFMGVRGV